MEKLRTTVLLMLGSQHAGEIMAARDAVLKVAKAQKLDIHGLTNAFSSALKALPHAANDKISHQEMALRCADWDEETGRLSDKERQFVNDMIDWRHPTEKQFAWLEKIYARAQQQRRK